MEAQLLLGVAALQLETRPGPTAANTAHVNALLEDECRRLGVRRYDLKGEVEVDGVHLDLLVLPEVRNEGQTHAARRWQGPTRKPSCPEARTS